MTWFEKTEVTQIMDSKNHNKLRVCMNNKKSDELLGVIKAASLEGKLLGLRS